MVRGLIELDEETNKILNIVKAKHGLNDKSQTIAFIVKRFKEGEQVQPQLTYINDGDKWLFAEEIPDIDLFFSQIWQSASVNECEYPSGKAHKKILSIHDGYHLLFYYGDKDSYEVGEHIVEKFLNNPEFPVKVNKEIIRVSDNLSTYCKKIPERNLDKLSNKELWKIWETHDKLHSEYYQWGWIPVSVDMWHNNLTEKMKSYLKSLNLSEEKVTEYFVVLTQPMKKSLIQVEQDEFLEIALEIIKHDKKLFEELYTKFAEQDAAKFGYKTHTQEYEEALERSVSEIVAHIKPNILKRIKEHYEKYFFVNHMWVGQASTFEHYLKELVKIIGSKADVKARLEENEKEFKKNKEKRDDVIRKLNLKGKWLTLFNEFGEFMVTKIYRRFAQIYAVYKMEFVQKEIARRFNLSLMQVRFMLPEEVKKALFENVVDKEELEERTRFCAYYAEKGKEVIFTGAKAKELAEKAKRVEIKDVSEFKGQIGCMGKARGIVKIITRPSDMNKMKQGDILVSIATDPDIVPAMKKAGAIITEQGGVTSHAAIVSRELGVPCVIGTKIATKVLKDGDEVEVDANKGIVKIIKR